MTEYAASGLALESMQENTSAPIIARARGAERIRLLIGSVTPDQLLQGSRPRSGVRETTRRDRT